MRWVIYGAYRRDTPAIPHTVDAPTSSYAKLLFARKHPNMHIVRVVKGGARKMAEKDDWYGRVRNPKYRRKENYEKV